MDILLAASPLDGPIATPADYYDYYDYYYYYYYYYYCCCCCCYYYYYYYGFFRGTLCSPFAPVDFRREPKPAPRTQVVACCV